MATRNVPRGPVGQPTRGEVKIAAWDELLAGVARALGKIANGEVTPPLGVSKADYLAVAQKQADRIGHLFGVDQVWTDYGD